MGWICFDLFLSPDITRPPGVVGVVNCFQSNAGSASTVLSGHNQFPQRALVVFWEAVCCCALAGRHDGKSKAALSSPSFDYLALGRRLPTQCLRVLEQKQPSPLLRVFHPFFGINLENFWSPILKGYFSVKHKTATGYVG